MKAMKSCLFAPILVLTFTVSLCAGVYVRVDDSRPTGGQETSKIYIEKARLRMESTGGEEDHVLIFRKDQDVLWIIDSQAKTYHEITRQDVARMKGQMDHAMKMMAEQMKDLPPEQRKMMEQMMAQQGGMQMPKPKRTIYERKGTGEKVDQWTCTRYEGYVDGQKTEDVWTADWRQLGIDPADLDAFRAMGAFFEALSQETDAIFKMGTEEFEKEGGYSGLPVKTIEYENGAVVDTSEVKEVQERSFDPSIFELPSGLKKTEQPWGDMR